MTTIKDERKLNELAQRTIEHDRTEKVTPPPPQHPPPSIEPHQGEMTGLQKSGLNFTMLLHLNKSNNASVGPRSPPDNMARMDEESKKGRFGWCEIENHQIPFIFRGGKLDRFVSVRMVERKLLSKFLNVLPPEVNSCRCIRSSYVTDVESMLLNEINMKHSDYHFGNEPFTTRDLIVPLGEAKEFYRFLDLCYKKLVLEKSDAGDCCGFLRMNGGTVVPFTVRDSVKLLPVFYFEGEIDHLKLKSDQVGGWDLAYLRFCFKVQGIRDELFPADDVCKVVALDEIKVHFPQGTTFEEYWPVKGGCIKPVQHLSIPAGNWTQRPQQWQEQPQQPQTVVSRDSLISPLPTQQQNNLTQQAHSRVGGQSQGQPNLTVPDDHRSHQQLIRQGQINVTSYIQPPSRPTTTLNGYFAPSHLLPGSSSSKQLIFKLTQIKEFPIEPSQQPPFKLQKALIDQKIIACINVRPYIFHDLMMTLPDFVKNFCPGLEVESARKMLQDILKIALYKGNRGHQDVLKGDGKCQQYDPVPLILVKDILSYLPQMKYMLSTLQTTDVNHQPGSKRMKVT